MTSPSRILNPSWSCALLATSFWKIPSTPCAHGSVHMPSQLHDQYAVCGKEDMADVSFPSHLICHLKSHHTKQISALLNVGEHLQQSLLHNLGPSLDQVGLQEPSECRHIAWPLPEEWGQQWLEDGHIEVWQGGCAQLYQLRKYLEHVWMELLCITNRTFLSQIKACMPFSMKNTI